MNEALRDRDRRMLRFAGWSLAHAAWSIEDGEQLMPLAVIERAGERELNRYEDAASALEHVMETLTGEETATVIVDGFVTPGDGPRTDALIVTVHAAKHDDAVGMIIQPYQRPRRSRLPLRQDQRLRLGDRIWMAGFEFADADDMLLEGASEHEEGRVHFSQR